jgi:hypothetical protein
VAASENHTLASVDGAPQIALALASSASVVASEVSTVVLNGTAPMAVAPAKVSLVGAAANAGPGATRTTPAMTAAAAIR